MITGSSILGLIPIRIMGSDDQKLENIYSGSDPDSIRSVDQDPGGQK